MDLDVAATVHSPAEALKAAGHSVEPVGVPVLKCDFALDVFWRLNKMEVKLVFKEATAGRGGHEVLAIAKSILAEPDTSLNDYIRAEQAADRQ